MEGGAPNIPVQPISYGDAIHFMRYVREDTANISSVCMVTDSIILLCSMYVYLSECVCLAGSCQSIQLLSTGLVN